MGSGTEQQPRCDKCNALLIGVIQQDGTVDWICVVCRYEATNSKKLVPLIIKPK